MKLFQLVRMYFQILGIDSLDTSSSLSPKNLLVAFIYGQTIIGTLTFCLFRANTVRDFGDSIYPTVTELACMSFYFITFSNISKILKLIERFEGFIINSE